MAVTEQRRLAIVVRALAVSLLLCLGVSWRLWLSTRFYPLVPVLGIVPAFPAPLDALVLAGLVGLLAGLVIRPLSQPLAVATVCVFAVLFFQDQSRLWPSFYLYGFLLLLLVGRRPDGGEPEAGRTLAGMRFAMAAAYFWAGVHKLTHGFLHEEFPRFIRPLTEIAPPPPTAIPALAATAAGVEMLIGVGLLTRRWRGTALAAALAMHALILVCIGPLRGHWNDSAWIWSQTMAVMLVLLFVGAPGFRLSALAAAPPLRAAPQALAVVLLGILPALNQFNRWDSALSFNVYSGNVSRGIVLLPPDVAVRLPEEVAGLVTQQDGRTVLDLNAWAMREFNAGIYPERRVFRAVFAALCGRIAEPSARLVIVEKSGWFVPPSTRAYACGDP